MSTVGRHDKNLLYSFVATYLSGFSSPLLHVQYLEDTLFILQNFSYYVNTSISLCLNHHKMAVPRTLLRCMPRARTPSAFAPAMQTLSKRFLQTSPAHEPYLLSDKDNGLGFIRANPRTPKPRSAGVTEIRGPYYAAYGKQHLQDALETMGEHVDGLKFAGGSFTLMPEARVRELIEIAHEHGVYVSTVRIFFLLLN